jgi:hypothetical protein
LRQRRDAQQMERSRIASRPVILEMMSSARSWRPMSLCARASNSSRCWRSSPERSAMRVVRSAEMARSGLRLVR